MPDGDEKPSAPRSKLKMAPRLPLRATSAPTPSPTLGQRLDDLRKVIINGLFLCVIGLVIFTIGKLITSDEMVIDPIGLPKNIRDLGYTEDAAALMMAERAAAIIREGESEKAAMAVKTRLDETDFELPVANFSAKSVIQLLRRALGLPQPRLVGDFVCPSEPCNSNTLELRLRFLDGKNPPRILPTIKGPSPDSLIDSGAEALVRVTDPLSLALYYYGDSLGKHDRRGDSLVVAEEMIAQSHPQSTTAYNILGIELIDRPEADEAELNTAMAYFQKAVELDQSFGLAYVNWGLALNKLGQHEKALEKLDKAAALLPGTPSVWQNLGVAHTGLQHWQEAEESLTRGLSLSPSDPSLLNAYGLLLVNKGEPAAAIVKLNQALESRPEFAFAQFNLGQAYAATGDKEKAINAYSEYLRLEPTASDRQDVETIIAGLRQ